MPRTALEWALLMMGLGSALGAPYIAASSAAWYQWDERKVAGATTAARAIGLVMLGLFVVFRVFSTV